MTTSVVHRPPRQSPPPPRSGELKVVTPPANLGRGRRPALVQLGLPILGSLGGAALMMANPRPLFLLMGGAMIAASVVAAVATFAQERTTARRRAAEIRSRYLAHVGHVRRRLSTAAEQQQRVDAWRHPEPTQLLAVTRDPRRLWERRRTDGDFLELRVGSGAVPLLLRPAVDGLDNPMHDADAVCASVARRLLAHWSELPGQALVVPAASCADIVLRGPRDRVAGAARAMLAQACAFHAPNDLQVLVAVAPGRLAEWEWCKWLPHVQDEDGSDSTGPARLVATTPDELLAAAACLMAGERAGSQPHLLAIVDGFPARVALAETLGAVGVVRTVVHAVDERAEGPADATVLVEVGGDGTMTVREGGKERQGVADALPVELAAALARHLARYRLSDDSAGLSLTTTMEAHELLGLGDVGGLDPSVTWCPRPPSELLRVPFGLGPDNEPVFLDLKESALGGHGPHGLLIGATGSGKSELLRTLLVGLVATHPPDVLALVLVDFKGGAAFASFGDLPHLAGMITNLADDTGRVERMRDALIGEQRRRQELLAAAGNLANVREYQAVRARSRPDLPPLPSLLVVIDEFSELLAQNPDFIDVFVAIGRLGRSLGIHLLFSSQRLEEGRLRGLDSHLSYRLGLRTFSPAESRTVLGVPDAYELPPIPGSGYLKVHTTVWHRFKAALVSAPYRPPAEVVDQPAACVVPFPAVTVTTHPSGPSAIEEMPAGEGPSVLDVIVSRLKHAAPQVHQVWVPPLPSAFTLGELLAEPAGAGGAAHLPGARRGTGDLRVPLGIVDKPLEQRVDVLAHDFAGADGHLVIVGGPQSGKTTTLRTALAVLAVTHSPLEVQAHAIDLGGGGLRALAALPHVGTVAGRLEPDLVRRIVGEVHAQLRHREALFAREGIDSMAELRRRRATGDLREERYGDLFLVIDGWSAFKQAFEDVEPLVLDIAVRGLSYGVHLLVATNRWLDIRPSLKDAIGGRLELRLNDPSDSDLDRKAARALAGAPPGRGLSRLGLCHLALPRLDGVADPHSVADGLELLVDAVADSWPGPGAPRVRLLPEVVKPDDLLVFDMPPDDGIPIGVSEVELGPAFCTLRGLEANLVVLGDSQSGKTSLLRLLVQALVCHHTPKGLQILVVDYRRTLLEAVPEPYLLAYAGAAPAAQQALLELRQGLEKRLPGADLTSRQLRERSWWSGPEVYVLVDDYDLVVSPAGNPLSPLADILPQAQDIGLHVVLARRSAGMGRAMYEPVLQRVRELGAPHLLLSGDPGEGAVVGPFKFSPQPPGRALYVRRNRAELVQLAYAEPAPAF